MIAIAEPCFFDHIMLGIDWGRSVARSGPLGFVKKLGLIQKTRRRRHCMERKTFQIYSNRPLFIKRGVVAAVIEVGFLQSYF